MSDGRPGAAGPRRVLCVNAGSSSLKVAVLPEGRPGGGPGAATVRAEVERIGDRPTMRGEGGAHEDGASPVDAPDHRAALRAVLDALGDDGRPEVVAHRIVHGGPDVTDHVVVDDEVVRRLEAAVAFAPLHLPVELALLRATQGLGAPQVACLDTAFHRDLVPESRRLPIPAALAAAGIRRYGFHGLSYEHLVDALGDELGRRAVLLHLGSGASGAAVLDGVGVDTTMGLTPTGGLVMGTRTGDLDPGVVVHLLRTGHLDADDVERVVDRESGLLGLAGASDVRDVLRAAGAGDEASQVALAVQASSIAKHVAALSTTLGGIDTLVFTAGVGERSPEVRAAVAARLGHLGVELDAAANAAGARVVSPAGAPVTVRVAPPDEERRMATHALRLTGAGAARVR